MQKTSSLYGKFLLTLSVIALGMIVAGTKDCQEDYYFGAQNSTPSPTPTGTDEGDDGLTTNTPTPTVDADATETPEPDTTPTAEPTTSAAELLNALSGVKQPSSDKSKDEESNDERLPLGVNGGGSGEGVSGAGGNWLGRAFIDDEKGGAQDSDQDGYTNGLENAAGSDPDNGESLPELTPSTVLSGRMKGYDDDGDGLPNLDESGLGTKVDEYDTDSDGVSDGAEIRSGTDPKSADSSPQDSDGDGLSDTFEQERGLSPSNTDTDTDGLRDDIEYALGTNPLNIDSDQDGILDGKEMQIGSDPGRPER